MSPVLDVAQLILMGGSKRKTTVERRSSFERLREYGVDFLFDVTRRVRPEVITVGLAHRYQRFDSTAEQPVDRSLVEFETRLNEDTFLRSSDGLGMNETYIHTQFEHAFDPLHAISVSFDGID